MTSGYSISETQSGTPSGVSISSVLSPVDSLSPTQQKMHVKIPLDHPVALYVQKLKAINGDLTTLDCLNQCVPKDDRELLFNHISDFITGFLFYRPELESRIQPIEILLKALVNDKQISEGAGLELIKIMNGDDLE